MDELLGHLRGSAGQLDSEGVFTLEPARALAVLRQYGAVEPRFFLLPLHQAAVALGASAFRVISGAERCRVELPGLTLAGQEHRELAGSLLRSTGPLRLLAQAVFIALSLPGAEWVELGSPGWRSRWSSQGSVHEPGPDESASLEVRGPQGELETVLERLRWGALPLELNGRALGPPGVAPGTALWRRLISPQGLRLPDCGPLPGAGLEVEAPWTGLLTYGPGGPGQVTLVAGGISALEPLAAPPGVGGVIAAADLRWDLSWQNPVQDDNWRGIATFLEGLDPVLARQAALHYTGLEGPAVRELMFRTLRRLRAQAPTELWEVKQFLQASGEPLSLREIVARPGPLRTTRRYWELRRPTGAVQLRSGQELAFLSSFVKCEEGDAWLERRRQAEERERAWEQSPEQEPRLGLPGACPLEGLAGEVAFGPSLLTLLKEHRVLAHCPDLLPEGVAGILNCDQLNPDEDWTGVRADAVWRRVVASLQEAVVRLYQQAPEDPPERCEELVYAWLGFWARRERGAGWDATPPAGWPAFPTQAGTRLSWAQLRSRDSVWYVEDPAPPRLPRLSQPVVILRQSVRRLLDELRPGLLRSMLDEYPHRPPPLARPGPIPASRLLLRSKLLRGELALAWDPKPPHLGEPGLELHLRRQGAYLASLWLPLDYGPIVVDVELPGVEVREGHVVQGEVFREQMQPIYERCRKLALKLTGSLHRYADGQWAAVRLYLLRQLVAESAQSRCDEVWGALSRAPLLLCVDGQHVSHADLVLLQGPVGYVDEPALELAAGLVLVLAGEELTLARQLLGDRLQDRRAELARIREEQSQVVTFITLPAGETSLEVAWGLEGRLGLLADPQAPSRVEVFEGRRRVQVLEADLPLPVVAAVEGPLDREALLAEARRLVRENPELGEEYRVALALRDPALASLPALTGLLRPLAIEQIREPVFFVPPRVADKIYRLEEIEPFLEALGVENPPILSRELERLVPWSLYDGSLEVERALWTVAGRPFPPVFLEQAFPGRSWLARSPVVGRLLGEVGLSSEGPAECLWLLPRGTIRLPGPEGLTAVIWTDQELEDARLREALPLLAQTLRRDWRRRVPRPELQAWLGQG